MRSPPRGHWRTARRLAGAAPAPLVALACLIVAAVLGGCPTRPARPFRSASGGGVRLSVLTADDLPFGPSIQARRGDFLLETDRMRAVIGGPPPKSHRDLFAVLLDVTTARWSDDGLSGLFVALEVDGQEIGLRARDVRPALDGERPRLTLAHSSPDDRIRISTELAVVPGRPELWLTSRVENHGATPARVRVGDRLRWYGGAPFAPGAGWVERDARATVPWLARTAARQGLALIAKGPALDVRFRSRAQGPDEQLAFAPAVELAPGAGTTHQRAIVLGPGELGALAELAWGLAGTPLGEVTGRLDPAPAWATIEARDASGKLVLVVETQGKPEVSLRLPAGSYRLLLKAPGGTNEQPVQIAAGESPRRVWFIVPGAARLSFRVTDERDRLLPARLVLRGVAPTPNPDLGPLYSAAGAANVVCTATGDGAVALPPGRYRVTVTHGPEYTLFEQEVDVAPDRGPTLDARLERVVDTLGWVAGDFHLHADPSGDSEVPLTDRVVSLLAEGIEVAVATDHNHVTDYAPSVQALGAAERVTTVSGVEVTTRDWGHFNAFPYPTGAPLPSLSETSPEALFPALRAAAPAAVIQVNHPRMGDIGYFNQSSFDPKTLAARAGFSDEFDTLEVFNGFDLVAPAKTEANLREWMELLARGRRHAAVGNSDSHKIAFEWAGYPRTYVRVEDDQPGRFDFQAVARALRQGRAVVTSGPFVDLRVDGRGPGADVRAENGRVKLELEVRSPPWLSALRAEVLVDGKPVLQIDPTLPEGEAVSDSRAALRYSGTLPITADAFVLVVVRGTSSLERVLPGAEVTPLAFTNPVFVDGDGDALWSPPATAAGSDGGALP